MNSGAIDNFNILEPLLEYDYTDTFYYLQIVQRKKDIPTNKSVKVIDNIILTKEKSLQFYQKRIKEMCAFFSARAYLRLNRRSFKKVALLMNSRLARLLIEEDFASAKNIFSWAAGNSNNEPVKRWIVDVDVDENNVDVLRHVSQFIEKLQSGAGLKKKNMQINYKILAQLPTKNGYHLITNPFDVKKFQSEFPGIDIHKDNPTVLYQPA